jgi:dTDP-4-dehydrorhamnose reductase
LTDALIGATGFIGTTLRRQRPFDRLFSSANIGESSGAAFQLVVCAAAPAQKWIANREPDADLGNIERLVRSLREIRCHQFVLVSTVDVFVDPDGVTEESPAVEEGLHPYGRNRLQLEKRVREMFPRALIVRLPGLVGPGLRKNVIYDFLNGNNLQAIDRRGVFQFYPTVSLWNDLRLALETGLSLVHLTAEPISVAEVSLEGFGRPFERETPAVPARYDMQTLHAGAFGGTGRYQYTRKETLLAIRAYAQSEPAAPKKSP